MAETPLPSNSIDCFLSLAHSRAALSHGGGASIARGSWTSHSATSEQHLLRCDDLRTVRGDEADRGVACQADWISQLSAADVTIAITGFDHGQLAHRTLCAGAWIGSQTLLGLEGWIESSPASLD